MEGFIGEVKYFAGPYPPKNWAFCEGQQLQIIQYTPLYSLIGIQFGGDAKNYFNLPDFRGRMCLGTGQSSGTSYRHQGDIGGYETIQITELSMPYHNHTANCNPAPARGQGTNTPVNSVFAKNSGSPAYLGQLTSTTQMKQDMVNTAGENYGHENMPPWTCLNMIICLYGYYPIRP